MSCGEPPSAEIFEASARFWTTAATTGRIHAVTSVSKMTPERVSSATAVDHPASSGSRFDEPVPSRRPKTRNSAPIQRTRDDCCSGSAVLVKAPSALKIRVQPAVRARDRRPPPAPRPVPTPALGSR
jgi:hypothetical protein